MPLPWWRDDTRWLVVFLGVVLLLPMLLGRGGFGGVPFDPTFTRDLAANQATTVLLGDSMLDTRIDPDAINHLAEVPVHVLVDEGSASAAWYLILKNHVAEAPTQPRDIVIFFRDRYLTDPGFRTRGAYHRELLALMRGNEPIADRLIQGADTTRFGPLADWLERVYPVQQMRDSLAERIARRAQKWARALVPGSLAFDTALDRTFDVRKLRADTPSELGSEDVEISDFDPSPERSFLPHLIDLANANNWRLTFYRVKRRPQDGDQRIDEPELIAYITALRAYLESRGARLVDETDDASIGIEFYSDGDHVAADKRPETTRRIHERLREVFER